MKLNETLRSWVIHLWNCGKESGPLLGCLLGNCLLTRKLFSAKEDQESESGDDPTRGLGRWFTVVKPKKNSRFEKPITATILEKELVKVENSMPRSQFLRITREV